MTTHARNWSKDWSVEVRVHVEREGKTVLDERSADVLAAMDRTASISAGARAMGISYRHAWLIVQAANAAAGQPLTETDVGGQRGGGARLTEYGRAALTVFEQLQQSLRASAAQALPKFLADTAHDRSVVHLFAAISLQEVVAQLLAGFALARPTMTVRTTFAASNELADQILAGSSADVFVSANSDQVDRLSAAGLIHAESRRTLAKNGLAAVANHGFRVKVRQPSDLLTSRAEQIIVAEPACPLGKCTADFLKSNGTYDALQPRLAQVDNSRAVVSMVRARPASLGLIFSSDVLNAPGLRTLFQVPVKQANVCYEGAVTSRSSSPTEAKTLLDFFSSKQAQVNFRRCGFQPA